MASDAKLIGFRLDPQFEARLLTGPAIASMLEGIKPAAVANARRLAPHRLGYLEEDIDAVVALNPSRASLVLRLFGRDFKTGWYEFGTERTPRVAMLRNGLDGAAPGIKWTSRGAR